MVCMSQFSLLNGKMDFHEVFRDHSEIARHHLTGWRGKISKIKLGILSSLGRRPKDEENVHGTVHGMMK